MEGLRFAQLRGLARGVAMEEDHGPARIDPPGQVGEGASLPVRGDVQPDQSTSNAIPTHSASRRKPACEQLTVRPRLAGSQIEL